MTSIGVPTYALHGHDDTDVIETISREELVARIRGTEGLETSSQDRLVDYVSGLADSTLWDTYEGNCGGDGFWEVADLLVRVNSFRFYSHTRKRYSMREYQRAVYERIAFDPGLIWSTDWVDDFGKNSSTDLSSLKKKKFKNTAFGVALMDHGLEATGCTSIGKTFSLLTIAWFIHMDQLPFNGGLLTSYEWDPLIRCMRGFGDLETAITKATGSVNKIDRILEIMAQGTSVDSVYRNLKDAILFGHYVTPDGNVEVSKDAYQKLLLVLFDGQLPDLLKHSGDTLFYKIKVQEGTFVAFGLVMALTKFKDQFLFEHGELRGKIKPYFVITTYNGARHVQEEAFAAVARYKVLVDEYDKGLKSNAKNSYKKSTITKTALELSILSKRITHPQNLLVEDFNLRCPMFKFTATSHLYENLCDNIFDMLLNYRLEHHPEQKVHPKGFRLCKLVERRVDPTNHGTQSIYTIAFTGLPLTVYAENADWKDFELQSHPNGKQAYAGFMNSFATIFHFMDLKDFQTRSHAPSSKRTFKKYYEVNYMGFDYLFVRPRSIMFAFPQKAHVMFVFQTLQFLFTRMKEGNVCGVEVYFAHDLSCLLSRKRPTSCLCFKHCNFFSRG